MTVFNYLNPKTAAASKTSGGGGKQVFVDDEEALRLAMEESLKLKALADMGRELDQREREGMETTSRAQQSIKESPIKLPNLRPDQSSLTPARKSPKTAHRSPRSAQNSPRVTQTSSKLSLRSPDMKSSIKRKIIEEEDEEEEEEEQGRGGKGKVKKVDKRRERDVNKEAREEEEGRRGTSGVKRKLKEKEEEEEEEEMLPSAQVEGKAGVGMESKENASPRKEGAEERRNPPMKRRNREEVFEDSFDILPEKEEPQFAHMGPVVRKRDARMQLEGWSCKQCEEFYKKAGSSTQEVKELINKCSRHRSKHKPLSNTPEGFWNPFFDE